MNDILENFAVFLQQQLELYGDEYICEASSLGKGALTAEDASPDTGATTLAEVQRSVADCRKCALSQTRTKTVFGSGAPQADIVLVGEAPGADEDRAGAPFVGKAGILLTKILASVQIKREDVYICNILKCRPPQNRDPLPAEIALCVHYLFAQLQLIRPKIIVCLGRISAQALLETTESLSQLRGKWHAWNGLDVMVTYHPAALLRNPGFKRETWEDMKRLRQRLQNAAAKR